MEKKPRRWLTPLIKQCWVSAGVALNMGQMGLIFGISSTLVPQLMDPGSPIQIDQEYGSWIASIPGFTQILGNLLVPFIMGQFGRKVANLTSIAILGLGWLCIVFATSAAWVLVARGLHGVGTGIISILGPLLVGEYTTPANRGVFLMSLSVTIAVGVFAVHAMGLYLSWKTTSLICVGIGFFDLLIVLCSPESPSWLASKGKYEECKKIFRWLRGDTDEEELDKLVNTNMLARKVLKEERNIEPWVTKVKKQFIYYRDTITRREFYLPIVIMINIYGLSQWSGVNVFCSFGVDLIKLTIGKEYDASLILLSLDFQRSVSTALGLVMVKKMKRKTLMYLSVGLNMLALTATAAYVYARSHGLLPFDSIYFGIGLLHIHMFSIATGAMPLGFILAGELFPLQFKSLAGGISAVCFSFNIFVSIKTVPFLLSSVQLYGIFMIYVGIQIFNLLMAGIFLPETKDRTLQDIEDEFRGKNKIVEVNAKFTPKTDSV